MTTDKMLRYNELTRQSKEIETELDSLKNELLTEMKLDNLDKFQTDFGTFSVVVTSRWKFSDLVANLEKSVKEAKEKEKEDGTAKGEESETLRFQMAK